MGVKLLALGLAFFLLTHPAVAVAQEKTVQEWSAIRAVRPGQGLVIEMKNGETIQGKLRAIFDGRLTLSRDKRTTDLELLEVQRVYRVVGRSRLKSALIGAGVGAATGAAIGTASAATNEANRREGFHVLAGVVFGALGAGVGAIAGVVVGNKPKRILIYEAK